MRISRLKELTINSQAPLAKSGSPLPFPAAEDLSISFQEFDGQVYELHYDEDTNNWQLDFSLGGQPAKIRYLIKDKIFLYFNHLDRYWDEVDPQLLMPDLRALANIENYILSETQLTGFNKVAYEVQAIPCNQDKGALCATFMAEDFAGLQKVVIYVNKQTRKIDHILSFNLGDQNEAPLTATYVYQQVVIKSPKENEIRYLEDKTLSPSL